jgi:hypothetical protein
MHPIAEYFGLENIIMKIIYSEGSIEVLKKQKYTPSSKQEKEKEALN